MRYIVHFISCQSENVNFQLERRRLYDLKETTEDVRLINYLNDLQSQLSSSSSAVNHNMITIDGEMNGYTGKRASYDFNLVDKILSPPVVAE